MKPLLYTAILNLIFLSSLSHTIYAQVYVNWEWEANHGLPDTLDWTATTLDLSGNLLMTGNTQTAEEMTNILTTKYDSEGDLLWEETYNYSSDGRDYGIAITTDASNNVYVAGASFDSTTLSFDYVVIKYDSDGEELWVSRYNGSDSLDDIPVAIIVDGDENVYVTGGSSDSTSMQNYVTIKFDIDGVEDWVATYDHEDLDDQPIDIELALLGDVVVTGASMDTTSLWDFATVIYDDTTGSQVSVRRDALPGTSIDKPTAFAMDNSGNYYLTGSAVSDTSLLDIHTIKLDDSLNLEWTATFDGFQGNDEPNAIGIDSEGNVYVTGYSEEDTLKLFATIKYTDQGVEDWVNYESSSDSTGSALATDLRIDLEDQIYVTGARENGSTYEVYTVCYAADGTTQWQEVIEGGEGSGIQVNNFGDVFVTGRSFNGVNATYLAAKYSSYHRNITVALDTSGNPSHVANEVIIRFDPDSLIRAKIDKRTIKFGTLDEFISPAFITQIETKLDLAGKMSKVPTLKVYTGLTPTDSTSVSWSGDTVETPPFWTSLIVKIPESNEETNQEIFEICDSLETLFPAIRYVHPDFFGKFSSNDPLYNVYQIGLHGTGNPNADINVEGAWTQYPARGRSDIVVGVYDNGIFWPHEDFMIKPTGQFKDSKVIAGKDYASGAAPISQHLTHTGRHGTPVAGIIGALTDNQKGVAGIAGGDMDANNPNPGVSLVSMKIDYIQPPLLSATANAIVEGAIGINKVPKLHIANHSWGVDQPINSTRELEEAIRYAFRNGVINVAARGNGAYKSPPSPLLYPACYKNDWVLNIGATNLIGNWYAPPPGIPVPGNDTGDWGSSWGGNIDLVAPGHTNLIWTTHPFTSEDPEDEYNSFQGTSAAAPHVAGVAALMVSYSKDQQPGVVYPAMEDVEWILKETAIDISASPAVAGTDIHTGHGLLDASAALELLDNNKYELIHLVSTSTQVTTIYSGIDIKLEKDYDTRLKSGLTYNVDVIEVVKEFNLSLNNRDLAHIALPNKFPNPTVWVRNASSNLWGLPDNIGTTSPDPIIPEVDTHIDNPVAVTNSLVKSIGYYLKVNSFPMSLNLTNAEIAKYTYLPKGVHASAPHSGLLPRLAISLLVKQPSTSIDEPITSLVTVSPNPFGYQTEIHFNSAPSIDPQFSFFDLRGMEINRVQIEKMTDTIYRLKGKMLSPGIYYLKVTLKNQNTILKIMVQP